MKNIQGIQLIMESNEELHPDFLMGNGYSRRGQAGLLIPMYCIHQE